MEMTSDRQKERRKDPRHRVKEGAFVIPQYSSGEAGQIVDICKGGLSFQYFANGNQLKSAFDIDILLFDTGYCLRNLNVSNISDLPDITNETPFTIFPIRRCGVRFNEMDDTQMTRLEKFIEDYALCPA
jgi:hypothetical protein